MPGSACRMSVRCPSRRSSWLAHSGDGCLSGRMNDEDVTGRIAEHFSELREPRCATISSSDHNQVRMHLMSRSKEVFVRRARLHANINQPGNRLTEDAPPDLLGHLREK